MSEPKCCGNCRWWEPFYSDEMKGECLFQVVYPDSAASSVTSKFDMHKSYGTDCPCHEMKGSGDVSR